MRLRKYSARCLFLLAGQKSAVGTAHLKRRCIKRRVALRPKLRLTSSAVPPAGTDDFRVGNLARLQDNNVMNKHDCCLVVYTVLSSRCASRDQLRQTWLANRESQVVGLFDQKPNIGDVLPADNLELRPGVDHEYLPYSIVVPRCIVRNLYHKSSREAVRERC